MEKYYAMMVDLTGRRCLIVGGGVVAERKMKSLIEAKANVMIVSPVVTPAIQKSALNNEVTWQPREYTLADGEGCMLVIAATNSQEVNEHVYRDAMKRDQWINVVDNAELCNFTLPSVVRRGNLQISISTSGTSPSLAKRIKAELEESYGEDYAFYLSIMEGIRIIVKRDIANKKKRSEILTELSSPYWLRSFRENPLAALKRLQQWIEEQKGGVGNERVQCR